MKLFILVIGMVLVVEGLPYAVAPERMQDWLAKLSEMPPTVLRRMGLGCLSFGLLICWIVQRTDLFS